MAISNVGNSTYTSELVSKIKGSSTSTDAKTSETKTDDTGVVYEPTKNTEQSTSTKKNTKVDSETIAKLKADADARLSQLQGIVEQLITKQGKASDQVSIWSQFRQGVLDGSITVDEATAKQAQEDISEDGYWGVKQTSERILDFAKALTGGDASKVEEMRKAIEKGFSQAAKLWGDELPEISQKTHEAVMKGLDEWAKESPAQ
ncbi:MAG: hypothetical protein PUC55_03825 [Lachnospiraceae bacterium]|nr:hypothetical protein [Lachnospiraceae bacterium]HCJ08017.1 hypothetical protein [Lachnospiraceae bacterium]